MKRIESFKAINPHEDAYWKEETGTWCIYLVGCGVASIAKHTVQENADGTITVQPSILIDAHKDGQPIQRHGYITQGVWKEC